MDNTRILFTIKQGTRSLESHIREFLAIAYYSDLTDIILIEIFCDGINQPLRSKLRHEGPRLSLAQFMDYALLTVGSAFTVGVAEERDFVYARVMAAMERTHQMAATTKYCVDTTVVPDPKHVVVVISDSIHPAATASEPINIAITVDRHESSQVTANLHESIQSQLIFMSHVMSQLIVTRQVTSPLTFQSLFTSLLTFQSLFTSPLTFQSLFTSPLTFQSLFTSPLIFQSRFTSPLTIQNNVTSQLISQRLVTSCLPHPDIQGQSFSILVLYPCEWCTTGVCTCSWYTQTSSL